MTASFTVKDVDALKNLPRRSGTARTVCSEETTPLRSSRMANELQHATIWQPSVLAQCKRGLSLLEHTDELGL